MLKLNYEGLRDRAAWEGAGVRLPSFDPAALAEKTGEAPEWIHFGPGNLFRGYVADLAQQLIEAGLLERGIVAVKTTPSELVELIYRAHDSLTLQVRIHADGEMERQVIGSISECLASYEADGWARLMRMAQAPELKYISLTITEKGYELNELDGTFKASVAKDIEIGPERGESLRETPPILAAMLVHRFRSGGGPLSIMSMDNFSHNGEKLRAGVLTVARAWREADLIDDAVLDWIADEGQVAFPNAVIDKITPGPDDRVAAQLAELGLDAGVIHVTPRGQRLAPFVNTEVPEYLVIEDKFPGGRTDFASVGVYLTDRDSVDRFERMKVCTCLNPLHTALAVMGCLFEHPSIAQAMADPDLVTLVRRIGYTEGLPVVTDPASSSRAPSSIRSSTSASRTPTCPIRRGASPPIPHRSWASASARR